jgi:DNA-binding PadR family transcriptional regulator
MHYQCSDHHHDFRHAMAGHGHSGRGWGRRHGRGGPGGGGFRIGKMLGDGDLKLIVLALLAEAPRHGYDIIKSLEEKSSGVYSPSPGVVYPTLTFLEEAGYATSVPEGTKKVFSITGEGQTHLDENRDAADAILSQIEEVGRKIARARAWSDWEEGTPDTPALAALNKARRRLRALIIDSIEGTEAEQQRLTEILNRAADEALGKNAG